MRVTAVPPLNGIYSVLTKPIGQGILGLEGNAMAVNQTEMISLRIPAEHKALIDTAAKLSGKNRTSFIVENALHCAEELLADRTQFRLSPAQWQEFNAALDAPVQRNPALEQLLATPAPWENA
jgi:uncharacterized protein (DUF1778 family)